MDETIKEYMEQASFQTLKVIKSKATNMKEPLLRKILSGEKVTEKNEGYLNAIQDMEEMLQIYEEEMLSKENDEE